MRALAPSLLLGRRLSDAVLGRDIERYPDRLPGRAALHAGIPVASPTCWLVGDAANFTLTNGLVSQWNDISGNANHATPPSTDKRPCVTAHPSYFRNRPGLAINAPQTAITLPGISAISRTQTVFVVGLWTNDNGSNDLSLVGGTNDHNRQFRIERSSGHLQMIKAGVSVMLDTTLALTKGVPFVASYRMASNVIDIRLNALTPQTNADTTTFANSTTTVLGYKLASGDTQPYIGTYYEVVAWASTLTSQEQTDVQAWLMTRWGI